MKNRTLSERRWQSLPPRHGLLYQQFITLLRESPYTLTELGKLSGVSDWTIGRWGRTGEAVLSNFEAALNVLGYKLKIVRIDDDRN